MRGSLSWPRFWSPDYQYSPSLHPFLFCAVMLLYPGITCVRAHEYQPVQWQYRGPAGIYL